MKAWNHLHKVALATLLGLLLVSYLATIITVPSSASATLLDGKTVEECINVAINAATEAGKGVVAPDGKVVPKPIIASEPIIAFLKVAAGYEIFNVVDYGAVGDGKTLDTAAINAAIEACSRAGGGIVYFPAGTYLSGSIHLTSNLVLYLSEDATILGAPNEINPYDWPERLPFHQYQDFGHSHWHNSLIWGEDLENIIIMGEGTINGGGMTRGDPAPGGGDKTIALLRCKNIMIYGIKIKHAGHFAVLATGCDNMIIDSVMIDTDRDGINLDCCRDVVVNRCIVNSPRDDAIVPKSSYALGYPRPSENILVKNCYMSGYQEGSLLDNLPKIGTGTGRFKCGTESNGGFKNIVVYNCHLQNCRPVSLEIVDGGVMENLYVFDVTCDNITSDAIFIRLGNRSRGPASPPAGQIRNVYIHNVTVTNAKSAVDISGIPGALIENVVLSDVRITVTGGGTKADAAIVPPEKEKSYPEPGMFGKLPAYGFFVRHVKGLQLKNVSVEFITPDMRPAIVLHDAHDVSIEGFTAERAEGAEPTIAFRENVSNILVCDSPSIPLIKPVYSGLQVSKEQVMADEPFSVNVNVLNVMSYAGMVDLELFVDGKWFDTKYVWLEPNETREVVFSDLRLYTLGTHKLTVWTKCEKMEFGAGPVTVTVVPTKGRFEYSNLQVFTPWVTGMVGEGKIGKIPSTSLTAEELSVIRLTAKNVGSFEHKEKVVLSINGEEVESRHITLEPGESRVVEFGYTFPESGHYTISVGTLTKDVYVWNARGKFVCTGLEILEGELFHNETIFAGEPFTVRAWISDTEYNPKFYGNEGGKIDLYVDGELVSWGFVSARKDQVKAVDIKLALEAGEHVISIGECNITVTIEPRPATPTFVYQKLVVPSITLCHVDNKILVSVFNWGLTKGIETVKLYVNNVLVDSKLVYLPPVSSPVILFMADKGGFTVIPPTGAVDVSFTYKFTEPGEFEVSVGGLTKTVHVLTEAQLTMVKELASKFITFDVNQPVTVYVARDLRLEDDKPLWLQEFEPTNMMIRTTDASFRVYEKVFPAGEVQLGVNWARTKHSSMYLVLVKPLTLGLEPLKITNLTPEEYKITTAKVGVKCYIDRNYKLSKIPSELEGLLLIRTANDDKQVRMSLLEDYAYVLTEHVHPIFNVVDYGAIPNDNELDTAAINAAIEACSRAGGGIVYFPAGTYLSGTINMRSNVTLYLSENAIIMGSTDYEDFETFRYWETENAWEMYYFPLDNEIPGQRLAYKALVFGRHVENVAIIGPGTIDGQGQIWWPWKRKIPLDDYIRPRGIQFIDSKNIVLKDFHITNTGAWTIHIRDSEKIMIDNITVRNPYDSPNTDGLDIDSCRDVVITNSFFDVGDDCVVLKAMGHQPTDNVVIVNNVMYHGHGGVVIGSETSGSVTNVFAVNNRFLGTDRGLRIKTALDRGGVIENIYFSDTYMEGIPRPVDLNTAYEASQMRVGGGFLTPWYPEIRNIIVKNAVIKNCERITLIGLPELKPEGITLQNLTFVDVSTKRDLITIEHLKDVTLKDIVITSITGQTERKILKLADDENVSISNFHIKAMQNVTSRPVSIEEVRNLSIIDSPEIPIIPVEYENLTLSKTEVSADEPFDVGVSIRANETGIAEVELLIDGEVYDTKYLWVEAGESKTVQFSNVKLYVEGNLTVRIGQLESTITVKPTEPSLKVLRMAVMPASLLEGRSECPTVIHSTVPSLNEPQYVVVEVQNIGTKNLTKEVELLIDNEVVDSVEITLQPGEKRRLDLAGNYWFSETGEHEVTVEGYTITTYVWNKYGEFVCSSLEMTMPKGWIVSDDRDSYPIIKAVVTDTSMGPRWKAWYFPGSPICLQIDGVTVATKWVQVEKGDEVTVTFDLRDLVTLPVDKPIWLEPGKHTISVKDKTLEILVVRTHTLDVKMDVGKVHFPGEIAQLYIQIIDGGIPINLTDSVPVKLLYRTANGTFLSLDFNADLIDVGLYTAEFEVPAEATSCCLVAQVEQYFSETNILHAGTAISSFDISSTLTDWNAYIESVHGSVAVVRTDIGTIKLNLTSINAELMSINENKVEIKTSLGKLMTDINTIGLKVAMIEDNIAQITIPGLAELKGTIECIDGNIAYIKTNIGTVAVDVNSIKDYVGTTGGVSSILGIWVIVALLTSVVCSLTVLALLRARVRRRAGKTA